MTGRRRTTAYAADPHRDQQLVVRAAWEVARLGPAASASVVDPLRTRAFDRALLALRPTLPTAEYDALLGRYDADRAGFFARLTARGG